METPTYFLCNTLNRFPITEEGGAQVSHSVGVYFAVSLSCILSKVIF